MLFTFEQKKMRFLILILAVSFLQSCFNVRSNQRFTYTKLSPDAYAAQLKESSNYYIIDVPTPKEYRKSHMKGAVNFSYLKFNFSKMVDTLDRKKEVFIYCQTCHRSPSCARILKRKGFVKVYDIKKGFIKWLKKDLPVTTELIMPLNRISLNQHK